MMISGNDSDDTNNGCVDDCNENKDFPKKIPDFSTNSQKDAILNEEERKCFYFLKLKNNSNSCFANAAVQCLLSCGTIFFDQVKYF